MGLRRRDSEATADVAQPSRAHPSLPRLQCVQTRQKERTPRLCYPGWRRDVRWCRPEHGVDRFCFGIGRRRHDGAQVHS